MIKIVEMEEQINHNEPIELLRNYGVSNESMCKFNICYENDTKATTYNRIIFPVYDADGNKCGMISRRINRDDGAVYINHTNNVYFYGLNFAINSSEDSFIICEGVIDTILLQQNGFDNAIGCLKTSISDDAILQLKKYKSKVYIAFDNDNYGRKCAQKLADIFASAGMEALIIDFGKYKDSLHKELNRISSEEELPEYYRDESGKKCFRFSDIHDLFNVIFKDDKENKDRWNSYVD